MEDVGSPPDGDSTSEPARDVTLPKVIDIAKHGDVILDATFENSKETLKSARKEARAKTSRRDSSLQQHESNLKPSVRLAFRVDLETLRTQSKFFDKLLGDTRFREGREVAEAFAALSARTPPVRPRDADPDELPWVELRDDDDGLTSFAGREVVFGEMLRMLHSEVPSSTVDGNTGTTGSNSASSSGSNTRVFTMQFLTTLAVLSDRFDCAGAVSKHVAAGAKGSKFKWPMTTRSINGSGAGTPVGQISRDDENVLRQKILVAWLLNMPGRFQASTRELIMNGSCRWGFLNREEKDETATWWHLQDGLEEELEFRRGRILRTVASIQRHFIELYTSPRRGRQCKLGYDSSVACDSFQLGEIFKFLASKDLLFAVDFAQDSVYSMTDTARLPVESIIGTLRQCPSYQIDKNHTNCGLRTRLLPILDFLQPLLSANSVPLSRAQWKDNRAVHAWLPHSDEAWEREGDQDARPFRFTRSLASDQRLRFENAMGADKLARDVFTATSWSWTEELDHTNASTTPKWSFR